MRRLLSPHAWSKRRPSDLHRILAAAAGPTSKPISKHEVLRALQTGFGPNESKALAVKLINLWLAKQHFERQDAVLDSRPLAVVVDPANACNLACPGCVHSERAKESHWFDWKPGVLAPARYAALLDRYGPAALFVTLCNYGEPLVNPETPNFIRQAKSYLLRTMLSTNLSLARFDADAYVHSGLDYMVLSIDGATQSVYERFRRKGNFDLVIGNIRKLVEAKRKSGRSTPVITWRFLAFEHNVHEIPAALEAARELGVDRFEASPAWDVAWDDPQIRPANIAPQLIEFGLDAYSALTKNWNPFPDSLNATAIEREFDALPAHLPPAPPNGPAPSGRSCEWLYKSITMDSSGRILPCCCAPRQGAELTFGAFNPATPGGEEVFNSPLHQLARGFFAGPQQYWRANEHQERHPFCVKCKWDKVADPDRMQMRNYFAMTGSSAFDDPALDQLTEWQTAS
ncbi:MAG TPA: radical SAM protein [Bryobacteraceae bacterium]|nr:radical SAM protein [Bryobacteraceae bacterium]